MWVPYSIYRSAILSSALVVALCMEKINKSSKKKTLRRIHQYWIYSEGQGAFQLRCYIRSTNFSIRWVSSPGSQSGIGLVERPILYSYNIISSWAVHVGNESQVVKSVLRKCALLFVGRSPKFTHRPPLQRWKCSTRTAGNHSRSARLVMQATLVFEDSDRVSLFLSIIPSTKILQ